MEFLFHFAFELVKISILGCIYATFTLLTFILIGYYKPNSLFNRLLRKKLRFWFLSGFSISAGLFFFMFTYFGDHGLGDSAKVPVGHFKVVNQIDGTQAYIENSKKDQVGIQKFFFDSNFLYAETEKYFNSDAGDYIIWNLRTGEWQFYKSKDDYLKVAKENNFPHPDNFEDFWQYYSRYWIGWRFWFLP